MQVAEQIPAANIGIGRRGRALSIFAGLILLAIATVYIVGTVLFTGNRMVLDVCFYSSACMLVLRTRRVAMLVGAIYLGLNLLAAPKQPVLFLRRFGLDVNSVVSRLIRKGLGRQFRFLTLDDGRFPAVDIPGLERWMSRLAPPAIAIMIVSGALAAKNQFSHQYSSNGAYAQTAAQMSIVIGYWTAILWALFLLALAHSVQMRRTSRYRIRSDGQLNAFLYDVRLLRRWRFRLTMLRPQAVVAKVSDSLWQQCVSAVSEEVGIVLIDVSDPTPNLQWEIEHSRRAGLRCVFIGENNRLRSWMGGGCESSIVAAGGSSTTRDVSPDVVPAAAGEAGSAAERVVQLVGNDCVLLYHGEEKLGGASFQSGLRQLLREAGAQPRQPSRRGAIPLMDRLWRISLAAIYHAFIFYIAVASGVYVGMVLLWKTASR